MRRWIAPVALILLLGLVGCGGGSETVAETTAILTEDYADALSIRAQLVLGTIRIEGTDLAVTETQAAQLLPLWQVARSLTRSGTGATEEVDATLDQIQAAMTPEQLRAIADLKLTRADNQALVQSRGLSSGTGEGTGSGPGGGQGQSASPEERATRQAERAESSTVGASEALLDELIDILEARSR